MSSNQSEIMKGGVWSKCVCARDDKLTVIAPVRLLNIAFAIWALLCAVSDPPDAGFFLGPF